MSSFLNFLKRVLPYWLVVRLNALRGISYSEDADVLVRREAFYKQFLKPGDLVFDIGANYGNRVQPFLSLGCRVVAVEPQIECTRYLNHKFGKHIHIERACVGATRGKATLHVGRVNAVSTLSEDFMRRTEASGRFDKNMWTYSTTVNVLTLDDLIKKYGTPKFIKIDTEGYEAEVLKGISETVSYLSFEYTLPEFEKELRDILAMLERKGRMKINVSRGEEMSFRLDQWVSLQEWLSILDKDVDRFNGWGDVYVSYEHPQKET